MLTDFDGFLLHVLALSQSALDRHLPMREYPDCKKAYHINTFDLGCEVSAFNVVAHVDLDRRTFEFVFGLVCDPLGLFNGGHSGCFRLRRTCAVSAEYKKRASRMEANLTKMCFLEGSCRNACRGKFEARPAMRASCAKTLPRALVSTEQTDNEHTVRRILNFHLLHLQNLSPPGLELPRAHWRPGFLWSTLPTPIARF